MKTGTSTGLLTPDVFYFGNLVGDTGNDSSTGPGALVSAGDLAATRVAGSGGPIGPTTAADFNKDGIVNTADATTARSNSMHALQFLAAPATPAAIATQAAEPAAAAATVSATVPTSPSSGTTVQAEPGASPSQSDAAVVATAAQPPITPTVAPATTDSG